MKVWTFTDGVDAVPFVDDKLSPHVMAVTFHDRGLNGPID